MYRCVGWTGTDLETISEQYAEVTPVYAQRSPVFEFRNDFKE